jgi:tricarballylate dehydrogenase
LGGSVRRHFYHNYLGGPGLMSGAVFGRLAGRSAAHHAMGPERAAAE